MQQTRDEITERLCWDMARRDAMRIARRLYRKPVVDRVYRLDEGALFDDFLHFLRTLGVLDLEGVCNSAIRALAKAGIFAQRVTWIAYGTDLETTDGYRAGGQVTRTRCLEDQRAGCKTSRSRCRAGTRFS